MKKSIVILASYCYGNSLGGGVVPFMLVRKAIWLRIVQRVLLSIPLSR